MATYKCDKCAKCCSYEIPLTILDINRIAIGLNITNKRVFFDYIQKEISEKSGIFKIAKKKNEECLFLVDKKCSIHDFEPNICRFYFCKIPNNKNEGMWIQQYSNNEEQKTKIWEQSVAVAVTKEYVNKHQGIWNSNDFEGYLKVILNNIKSNNTQTLKLTNDNQGNPICMLYDCSKCKNTGELATETIITLLDINHIVKYLNISWELFFASYIHKDLSLHGLLQLKRNVHCVFHLENSNCLIDNVKPHHCKFTTCPLQCHDYDKKNYDNFYLGSGTIEQQYEHQVALSFTREYIDANGQFFNPVEVNRYLAMIDDSIKNKENYDEFCNDISKYRYLK